MNANLAILTIGVVPLREVLPLLTEHIREDQITHISLLGSMTREEVMKEYAALPGEEIVMTRLNDLEIAGVSRRKIERDLQAIIEELDNQGYDVILLMSTAPVGGLVARKSILLEPLRIIPPLVASIVDGHQVGVMVPTEEFLPAQRNKWQALENAPYYALAPLFDASDTQIIAAGRELIDQGADVLMLDCVGYNQKHRDVLQKALDVPVLLSNILVARLASELLV